MDDKTKNFEEKYQNITDQSLMGIFILQDNVFKYINEAVSKINGRSVLEMMDWTPKEFLDSIHPDDREKIYKLSSRRQDGDMSAPPSVSCRVFTKSGKIKWIEAYGKSIVFQGKPADMSMIIDITERKRTEQKLKESEEKYRLITENANDMISLINENFEIEFRNEVSDKVLGYTNKELIGKSPLDRIHPEDIKRITKVFRDGFKKGEAQAEVRAKHKDGHYLWLDIKGKTFIDENNQKKGILVSRDITERKNTEQQLKESEEKFRLIADQSLVGIHIIQDNVFKYANQAIALITGYPVEELLDFKPGELAKMIHPDDLDFVMEQIRKKQAGEKDVATHYTFKSLKKDGSLQWMELYSKTIMWEGSPADMVISIGINERKMAEQQLKISEKKYRHLFDNSPDMIILTNLEGTFIDVNREFLDYSGYTKEEILGKNFELLTELTSPATLPLFVEKYKEILSNGYCKPVEFHFKNNKGVKTWINFEGHAIELEEENIIEVIIRDITARMEAREKLKEAFERETFFKNLFTHDINNVLNNIQNSLSLFTLYQNNPEKQEEIRKIVNILKEQVVRGTHLVSNIRQLSEIEEDKLPLESIDAAKTLEDAIKLIQEGFQTKIIDVHIDSPGDTLLVQANDLLLNVFENILNNAVKYNEHSIVEIIIRISEMSDDGVNYMKFEFTDNGIGIDDFKKATIFKEGYKKEKGGKGLGFGLSLVKKIIAGYKGRIWVEDKIMGNHSKGSNFILLIPKK